ncbi:MAG: ExeM/NucH family extracellular endonuclease [Ardenticatenaceae bacterium]|nr:ExeM/NucH family extracellular endonuclease [Ardenticatenaceae bacterium]
MSFKRTYFTMLLLLAVLALFLASGAPGVFASVETPFVEPFNNSSQFTSSTPFFSDAGVSTGYDFFGISDGAGGGDFGGDPIPNVKAYTGFTDNFLTGMDLDGEGATLPIVLEWTGINIVGLTDLSFSGDFAEFVDGTGNIDVADYILVEYQLDGSGYQNLLRFCGDLTFNGVFREDVDFDGVCDGTALGSTAQNFVKSIAGTGSALDLRLTLRVDAGDEDFGIDNFQITGQSGSLADTAPQVASTSPANGAVDVAVDAPVTVTFNEAVTLSGTFDIACAPSGNNQTDITPTTTDNITFSFAHVSFTESDNCSLTIPAASVADVDADDPPDNMATEYTFNFSIVAPVVAPELLINEIDADQAGTDSAEFVELYDGGVGNTDLTGLVLVFFNGSTDTSYQAFDLDGLATDASGYFVLCGDAANTPNCDLDVTPNTDLIQNGADAIALYTGDAAAFPTGTAVTTTNLLDAIVYDTDDADDAGLLVLLNAGQPQVNENSAGNGIGDSNQRCANGSGGARNTDTYAQFAPTPGQANLCAVIPPGQTLPLVEGFDDCTLAGWEIVSVDADTSHTWSCNATYSNIEANGYGDTAPADEWLITPPLNLDAQDYDTLTFRNYTNFTDINYPQLSVLYSTDYTGSGDIASATWTALSGITFSPEGSATWVDSGEVDLSGIGGTNVYVAFRYVSSGTGSGTAANWRIDEVNIFEGTPPPPPSGTLFFSEYIEGSSLNKAVEIFNGTGGPVDLSTYTVELYSNGAASPSASVALSGSLANGDVFVMANSAASAAILAVTDLTNNSVINFNGDDAIVLRNSGVVVDVIGQVGFDPGSEWGAGLVSTQDNTIRRQPQICTGDTNPNDAFDPALEWDGFALDTFDGLGSHTADCVATGQPLPLTEGFDDCTLAGWEIISVDADTANTWACNATYSNIEVNGYGDTAPANEWLITPPLNMDAQGNDRLTFRSQTSYTDSGLPYPQLAVLYSTDYSGDPMAATWTALSGITFSPENSSTWTDSGVIDLSGISGGNVYFAFHYMASSTSSAARWRLDSINFYERTGPFPYKIHEIQGNGLASPVVGEQVLIEGVVVGDFQELGQFGGFHVQEEDADADADPATSEGIFVYNYSNAVSIGDIVQVVGTVAEYNGLTEITSVSSVTIIGSGGSVTPTAVSLPVASLDELEAFEGMLVTFPQDLYISEYFNFDRYNEIVVSAERQDQPTAVFDPGSPEAAALTQANILSRITLDDGRSSQNSDPALHPNGAEFTTTNTFRGGDILQNITGVMDYANSVYKIQPTQGAVYVPQNLRTEHPDNVGGTIKVASFNVLNYFSTIDTGAFICGPAEDQECRGADTPEEFQRQRDKIFAALAAIDADVVGLIEIENHVTDAAVQDLVTGLNAYLGYEAYAYIATGPIGTDAIKQAFIYKPASVNPVGAYAILDSTVDPRFLDDYNRPALAQTFYDRYTGGHFTVVVNHLKSKGSDCNAIGDPDLGDGAGNCNVTRTLAAQALVDWLATDPTNSGDPDYLIIGDLNSYDKEDPIDAILAGADDLLGSGDDYTDLLYTFVGEHAYSYVFDGQIGYLDHGLANATLRPQVVGTTAWHINADEPDIIDYDMNFKQDAQDALWEPTPYRSSDHDPVVIGLLLEPEGLIVNDNGCYVIGIEGTPYAYAYNLVTTDFRSLKYFRWGGHDYQFKAVVWAKEVGVSENSCFEIHGTNKKDMIIAGNGDDTIFGYDKHDILYGRKGNDVLIGGDGRDYFFGGSGYDTVLDYQKGDKCVSIEEGCPEPKCKYKDGDDKDKKDDEHDDHGGKRHK